MPVICVPSGDWKLPAPGRAIGGKTWLGTFRGRARPRNVPSHVLPPIARPGAGSFQSPDGTQMTGMPFRQYHWTRLEKGSTVVVTLSTGANVRLMTPQNFQSYKSGRSHKYVKGGLVGRSPHRIVVPSTGSWYLTV